MPAASLERADRACLAQECLAAIGLLEEAVRLQPHDLRLHYRLGLCYGGSCRPHSWVRPAMAVPYLRQALALIGPRPTRLRAGILEELGKSQLASEGEGESPGETLRAAMGSHLEAAGIYQSLGIEDDWARLEFNLGNSCCDLSDATGEDHWQEAIAHYQASLLVRTREKDPQRYAAVLENLGTAYRRLPARPGGNDAGNTITAIQCYRRALAVYVPTAWPEQHAALQNNLGNAFLSLPQSAEKSPGRNAARALRHFERALRLQPDSRSRAFAITQYNCAQAHLRLARVSPAPDITLAAGCLEAAAAAFAACGDARNCDRVRAQLERLSLAGSSHCAERLRRDQSTTLPKG